MANDKPNNKYAVTDFIKTRGVTVFERTICRMNKTTIRSKNKMLERKETLFNIKMMSTELLINDEDRLNTQIEILRVEQESLDLNALGLENRQKWLELELQIQQLEEKSLQIEDRKTKDLKSRVQTFAGPFANALANNIGKANKLEDALRGALNQLIAMVAQAAILAAIMIIINPKKSLRAKVYFWKIKSKIITKR